MPIKITITTHPPFQKISHRHRAAQQKLEGQKRDSLRELGRDWQTAARKAAPGKGKFRRSHIFRTFDKGAGIFELRTYRAEPLGTIIEKGSKPHKISARHKKALFFFWPKINAYVMVPKKGGFKTHMRNDTLWVGKGYVDHPGTKANPYMAKVMSSWRPKAVVALRKIARRFVIDLQGD